MTSWKSGLWREAIDGAGDGDVGADVVAPGTGEIGVEGAGLLPEGFEDRQCFLVGHSSQPVASPAPLQLLQLPGRSDHGHNLLPLPRKVAHAVERLEVLVLGPENG